MRSHWLYAVLILLTAIIVGGCSAASSKVTKIAQNAQNSEKKTEPETTYPDGVRRITVTELQDEIKKNDAFIIDTRNEASYNAAHIPGAKLIPATDILKHLDEIPKNKLIVTYCS
jgi:3-mercaptopyruvate sulfurtransferase SseA